MIVKAVPVLYGKYGLGKTNEYWSVRPEVRSESGKYRKSDDEIRLPLPEGGLCP
jgi:hypothetical protein